MPTALVSNGTATSGTSVDCSSVVTASATHIAIRAKNDTDSPFDVYFKKTGDSTYEIAHVLEGRSVDKVVGLNSAKTFMYYLSGGTVDIDLISELVLTDVTETTIETAVSNTDWELADLSPYLVSGSTYALVKVTNNHDSAIDFTYRSASGQSEYTENIAAGATANIWMTVSSAGTFHYKVSAGNVTLVYVGTATSSVVIADIWNPYLIGYDTDDISNVDLQKVLDDVTDEVDDAVARHLRVAGYAVNTNIKKKAIKLGTAALALWSVRGKGAAKGLTQDRIIVSTETADRYYGEYRVMLENLRSGTVYGA